MSTPLGHLAGSYIAVQLIQKMPRFAWLRRRRYALFFSAFGLLPDVDGVALPLLGIDFFMRHHRTITHSAVFLLPVALLIATAVYLAGRRKIRYSSIFIVAVSILFVHLLQDALNGGYGVLIFFPLSRVHFSAHYRFLPIFNSLLVYRDLQILPLLRTMAWEVVIFLPLILITSSSERYRRMSLRIILLGLTAVGVILSLLLNGGLIFD